MKYFFKIDEKNEQIILVENDGDYQEEFKKTKPQSDIWFNLSNITNRSGNLETKLDGDAIMDSYAFRIKNFGDKDYANRPKVHFQFMAADEDVEANQYYITNCLNDEWDGISLFIDCYLSPDFLKEFSDRVSKKEVETLQVFLDISTTNHVFKSLDMGGNTYLVILKDIENLKNENGEFGKVPKNFKLHSNLARGVNISWTSSYKLEVFNPYKFNELE